MKEDEQAAVVCVRKSAWERVTETEELVGRLSFGSRFPQYLVLSILFEVWGEGRGYLLDNCDVYWGSRACLVYFCHCQINDCLCCDLNS